MILENIFRFKLTFTECKTYEDVLGMLKDLETYFKTLKSLGVKKLDGAEEDYHRFEIDTDDTKKIHKLKEMGFVDQKNYIGRKNNVG